ncbi:MAG: uroporphyrinogen-III synthase [Flavobacteriaceae bacterium]
METQTLPFSAASYPHYVCSSQNAVRALSEYSHRQDQAILKSARWYCVGTQTAEALEQLGFKVNHCSENAETLIEEVLKPLNDRILWFSGVRKTRALEQFINNKGCDYIDCYLTRLVEKSFNSAYDALLFFSPSGVESFLKANEMGRAHAFCIGETTAKAVRPHTEALSVSPKATSMQLVLEVIKHFKKDL